MKYALVLAAVLLASPVYATPKLDPDEPGSMKRTPAMVIEPAKPRASDESLWMLGWMPKYEPADCYWVGRGGLLWWLFH